MLSFTIMMNHLRGRGVASVAANTLNTKNAQHNQTFTAAIVV